MRRDGVELVVEEEEDGEDRLGLGKVVVETAKVWSKMQTFVRDKQRQASNSSHFKSLYRQEPAQK